MRRTGPELGDALCKRHLGWLGDQIAAETSSQLTLGSASRSRSCTERPRAQMWRQMKICRPLFHRTFLHLSETQPVAAGTAPTGMARRWFLLVKNTAGRIGDAQRIGPANEVARSSGDETTIFIRSQRTEIGQVPISRKRSLKLAGRASDAPGYFLTDCRKPFALSGSLDNRVRRWIVEPGPAREASKANQLQHGILARRAEETAETGRSAYEGMPPLSRSNPKAPAIYTERIEQARLAKRAARRMEQASKTKVSHGLKFARKLPSSRQLKQQR